MCGGGGREASPNPEPIRLRPIERPDAPRSQTKPRPSSRRTEPHGASSQGQRRVAGSSHGKERPPTSKASTSKASTSKASTSETSTTRPSSRSDPPSGSSHAGQPPTSEHSTARPSSRKGVPPSSSHGEQPSTVRPSSSKDVPPSSSHGRRPSTARPSSRRDVRSSSSHGERPSTSEPSTARTSTSEPSTARTSSRRDARSSSSHGERSSTSAPSAARSSTARPRTSSHRDTHSSSSTQSRPPSSRELASNRQPDSQRRSRFGAIPENRPVQFTEDQSVIDGVVQLSTLIDQHAVNFYSRDDVGNGSSQPELNDPNTRHAIIRRHIAEAIINDIIRPSTESSDTDIQNIARRLSNEFRHFATNGGREREDHLYELCKLGAELRSLMSSNPSDWSFGLWEEPQSQYGYIMVFPALLQDGDQAAPRRIFRI